MEISISLNIRKEQYESYYQGKVGQVMVRSSDGRKVRFPANILRPFVTHEGVCGRFKLSINEKGKLLSIDRLPGDKLH